MEAKVGRFIEEAAIERALKYRENRDRNFRAANAEGRKESAKRYVDELIGIERVLDMLGIEYEDE